MTDEDESTDSGIIVAAERAILKFLRDREANEAAQEDRGTSTVNQLAQHPAPANPVKKTKTIEELAAMIHQDLSNIEGCPKRGVNVTVYGLNPWNSLLTFGVDAGSVPNKTDLQSFRDIITERLKRLYDVRGPHVSARFRVRELRSRPGMTTTIQNKKTRRDGSRRVSTFVSRWSRRRERPGAKRQELSGRSQRGDSAWCKTLDHLLSLLMETSV